MQKTLPTRDGADKDLDDSFKWRSSGLDANNLMYAVNASRNYDPSPQLEKSPHLSCSSIPRTISSTRQSLALQNAKSESENARFVLIPISDETRGHGTHTKAVVWKQYLTELLEKSAH